MKGTHCGSRKAIMFAVLVGIAIFRSIFLKSKEEVKVAFAAILPHYEVSTRAQRVHVFY